MRRAKLTEIQRIEITDEEFDLSVGRGEAAVRVKAAGICGTDLHIFAKGRADVALPRVMGHELSGIVTAVGDGVSHLKKGDHVVLDPVFACGTCRACRRGKTNVCSKVRCFGVQMDGGFQDYIKTDARRLYRIPKEWSFTAAALAEPFSVASNILARTAAAKGDRIAILGAGTIGLCILQAAKGIGAEVLISDIEAEKLKKAKSFGADYTIHTGSESFLQEAGKIFPEGADVVIDAVGKTELLQEAVKLAGPGGSIGVLAFDEKEMRVIPAGVTRKELTLAGSRMNRGRFPEVLSWMKEGKIHPEQMITAVYPLERIQEAFEHTLRDKAGIKTILTF